MKQKNNNVWILTVTFLDLYRSATSKYHTYTLTVDKSSNDHQPVIDVLFEADRKTFIWSLSKQREVCKDADGVLA